VIFIYLIIYIMYDCTYSLKKMHKVMGDKQMVELHVNDRFFSGSYDNPRCMI